VASPLDAADQSVAGSGLPRAAARCVASSGLQMMALRYALLSLFRRRLPGVKPSCGSCFAVH
jgi:hypothetical protein